MLYRSRRRCCVTSHWKRVCALLPNRSAGAQPAEWFATPIAGTPSTLPPLPVDYQPSAPPPPTFRRGSAVL